MNNTFGSKDEYDYSDIKRKFKIITDQGKIKGFRLCFGDEFPTRGGGKYISRDGRSHS